MCVQIVYADLAYAPIKLLYRHCEVDFPPGKSSEAILCTQKMVTYLRIEIKTPFWCDVQGVIRDDGSKFYLLIKLLYRHCEKDFPPGKSSEAILCTQKMVTYLRIEIKTPFWCDVQGVIRDDGSEFYTPIELLYRHCEVDFPLGKLYEAILCTQKMVTYLRIEIKTPFWCDVQGVIRDDESESYAPIELLHRHCEVDFPPGKLSEAILCTQKMVTYLRIEIKTPFWCDVQGVIRDDGSESYTPIKLLHRHCEKDFPLGKLSEAILCTQKMVTYLRIEIKTPFWCDVQGVIRDDGSESYTPSELLYRHCEEDFPLGKSYEAILCTQKMVTYLRIEIKTPFWCDVQGVIRDDGSESYAPIELLHRHCEEDFPLGKSPEAILCTQKMVTYLRIEIKTPFWCDVQGVIRDDGSESYAPIELLHRHCEEDFPLGKSPEAILIFEK